MRNHEVVRPHALLNADGNLSEPGWSRHLVQQYDRSQIKAPAWRIKEWDYYLVVGKDFAGAFTIADDGYIGLQSVSLLSLGDKPWEHTETVLTPFPMGKLKLPGDSSSGETVYEDQRLQMRFSAKDSQRRITCHFERFWNDKPFDCRIWPYRIMEVGGRRAITIASICDELYNRPLSQLAGFLKEGLADAIFSYADAHPEIVKPYYEGYPVLMFEKQELL